MLGHDEVTVSAREGHRETASMEHSGKKADREELGAGSEGGSGRLSRSLCKCPQLGSRRGCLTL